MKKTSVYIPDHILEELKREAKRQERSHSWLLTLAWERARKIIAAFPAPPSY